MAEEKMNQKPIPDAEMNEKEIPKPSRSHKKIPKADIKTKEIPTPKNPENTVTIGGVEIEIKPTKLKYHRNNTAYFYKMVENIALPDIMAMPKGAFGDDRDGDKALMDWLIAVVDDEDIIVKNYDDIDVETIERMLSIFRRLNKIDEKEARQKNAMSQAAKG